MDKNKLQKLYDTLKLLERDTISPSDLANVLAKLVKVVNDAKVNFDTLSSENLQKIKDSIAQIEGLSKNLEKTHDTKTNVMVGQFDAKIALLKGLLTKIQKIKATPGKDGKDGIGIDGINGKDGKDGKDGSPDKRLQIVEKINTGEKKDLKIELKQIDGFDKLEKNISERALSILDQRTKFLINKTVKVDGVTITGDGTDSHPLVSVGGGSGTPGGSDTQVQFNDAGAFGGDAGLTYNKTTNELTTGDLAVTEGYAYASGTTPYWDLYETDTAKYGGMFMSGSNLHFYTDTGKIEFDSNLKIDGATIEGSLIPSTDGGYDVGSSTSAYLYWYLSTGGGFYWNNQFLLGGYGSTGISVGTGTANAVVSSSGNFDLILQTGNATTGNITIADGANGAITLSPNGSGYVAVGGGTTAAELRFLEPSGSGTNYTALKAAAQAASITYTLPNAVGGAGTFLTDAAGNGTLSWATPAGSGDVIKVGTPANDQVGVWTGDGTIEGVTTFTYSGTLLHVDAGATFNDTGADVDFRIEADNNANMFFLDASVDRIGIGTGAPDQRLHIEQDDATNNGTTIVQRLTHTTSGTAGSAIGVGIDFETENGEGTNSVLGSLSMVIGGSESSEAAVFLVRLNAAGSTNDKFKVLSDGSTTHYGAALLNSSDGGALGSATKMWSDLFLASGGVVNFAAGDVTLTHAAGKLTFGGDGAVEIDFANNEITNVDIDSGAIDATVIGGGTPAAGTFTTLGGTTITASTGFALGDGDYIGVTSNEILTFATAGTITVSGADFLIADGNGLLVGHTAQIAAGEVTSEAQILGTTETDASLVIGLWSATDALSPQLKFLKNGNAAIGSNTIVADNEELGKIQAYGADGVDNDTLIAEIAFNVDDAAPGAGAIAGEIVFATATTAGTLTTAMTIDATQQVIIATALLPDADGGADLGALTQAWDDLFLDTGATINFDNSNVVLTHTAGILTLGTGTLKITTPTNTTTSVVTIDGTQTLTNKRVTKRVVTAANDATAVIDVDVTDDYYLTAMSAATEISTTGTPTAGQTIFIGLKDDGTTRALTWTGITALGVTLPTTTTVSKQHIIGLKYIGSAWRAVGVSVES